MNRNGFSLSEARNFTYRYARSLLRCWQSHPDNSLRWGIIVSSHEMLSFTKNPPQQTHMIGKVEHSFRDYSSTRQGPYKTHTSVTHFRALWAATELEQLSWWRVLSKTGYVELEYYFRGNTLLRVIRYHAERKPISRYHHQTRVHVRSLQGFSCENYWESVWESEVIWYLVWKLYRILSLENCTFSGWSVSSAVAPAETRHWQIGERTRRNLSLTWMISNGNYAREISCLSSVISIERDLLGGIYHRQRGEDVGPSSRIWPTIVEVKELRICERV